jgi:hypothetical protein
VGLFSFFLCEYLFFEQVHLYTYDFFAERVGFKLGWGCLLFYPTSTRSGCGRWPICPIPGRVDAHARGRGGDVLPRLVARARGEHAEVHLQAGPTATFLGIAPEVVTDGQRKLLVSGFWGCHAT